MEAQLLPLTVSCVGLVIDQKIIKPWMLAQNNNKLEASRSQGYNTLNFQGSLLQITALL